MARWLELSPDYRCNNRCLGCFSVQDTGPSMSPREIVSLLAHGLDQGARSLWLGGGEPTLRKDLLAIVKKARDMGYTTVRLQTNAMLLAYDALAKRCADAGVTEVSVSLKGHTAELHDELTGTPGCHALMEQGIANVRALNLTLEGDVLLYRRNMHSLTEIITRYAQQGLTRFWLWMLSAVDHGVVQVTQQVPTMPELVTCITHAMDTVASWPAHVQPVITSLHTPPCTVPQSHHRCLFFAPSLELLVGNPGGHVFRLEDSPIEGGTFLPGCSQCSHRAQCNGIRNDYLALHGPDPFRPIG